MIRPRILRDVSNIDTSTTIIGKTASFPFGFSPAAAHKLAHPDGEVGTSRAAGKHNIPMGLSAYSTASLEDVISAGQDNVYFMQTNFLKNKDIMRAILRRAEGWSSIMIILDERADADTPTLDAGYHAIMLTVDAPTLGIRLNESRNIFNMPNGTEFPNLLPGQSLEAFGTNTELLAYG